MRTATRVRPFGARGYRDSTSRTTGVARLAAAVITYSATTASSPRSSSAARAAWAADPRMWRTCVAFASGWRYAAAAASPAALAACRAASFAASPAARWASAAAVRWRRERAAPSAKTRAASRAAAGRGSSGRSFTKRTSAGSAHAAAYPAIARSSSIVNSKSPERVCIPASLAQRRRDLVEVTPVDCRAARRLGRRECPEEEEQQGRDEGRVDERAVDGKGGGGDGGRAAEPDRQGARAERGDG